MSNAPPASEPSGPPSTRRQLHGRQVSQHAPLVPSRLRESVAPSPVDEMTNVPSEDADGERQYSPFSSPPLQPQTDEPLPGAEGSGAANDGLVQGQIVEPTQGESNARTRLLEDYHRGAACGSRNCNHGTFSPRLRSYQNSIDSSHEPDGRYGGEIGGDGGGAADPSTQLLRDPFADTVLGGSRRDKNMSTTQWLAFKHGIRNQRLLSVLNVPPPPPRAMLLTFRVVMFLTTSRS